MDKRILDNIQPFESGLETIVKLQPVSFTKKGESAKHIGLVADDLLKVAPVLVKSRGGILSVEYDEVLMLCINAIKDLQKEIEVLKSTKIKKTLK